MAGDNAEPSALACARVAGLLYLVIIVSGITGELLIRSSLIAAGDAATTAANILQSSALFRAGFAADAIMVSSDIALAVLLYRLLRPVSETLALMAAVFRLVQAGILGVNLLNYYAPLLLLTGTGYAGALEAEQSHALVSFFLDLHGHGYDLGLLFFGLSNLVLGYLVARSGYLPAVLGYGLQAAGAVYLLGSLTRFLLPGHLSVIEPLYLVPLVAELAFCLWLLVKGVRTDVRAHAS